MLSRWARRWSSGFLHPLVCIIISLGVTANGLTAASLILAAICGFFIAIDRLLFAALLLCLSGLLDALDGEVARTREKMTDPLPSNRLGPFIDSVADHYGDFAIYFGFTWRAVHQQDALTILLAFAAMFGSLVGSHIRSRAGMVGIDTKNVGVFTRMERYLLFFVGLVSSWITPALGMLALMGNISALQRIIFTLRAK
jgi:CDP-diacylglycerol---glycerol-3-phosphate 3-phosphatidyltransferase